MQFLEESNRLYLEEDGKAYAEITWSNAGETVMIVDHTFVDDAHRGQGLAQQLVEAVADKARADGKKIMPLCPFAKKEFETKSMYEDVWKK
ncbi:GNAT family N-acetyltransferase [Caryophanon tenue]|uniref:GNAT family acetyltransferase n=1 Tax=Caryophanon tenue TaxID=33978 RepID=A0A1C0Y5L1_9BACL|nr:GNAT family N-acetyltransferase [Caryophanon tenue]OCS82467.1 GNAT family acetyltransferase [Caryophanon tenue]